MKKINLLFIPVTISILLIAACSKDGAQGPQGNPGSNGAQGNANVKTASDSTHSSSDWTYLPGIGWYVDFIDPTLSSSFISNGGFAEVFLSTDNQKAWTPLPSTYYADTVLNAQMTYTYYANTVQILFTWNDMKQHTDPVTTFGTPCYFKITCVAAAANHPRQGQMMQTAKYEALLTVPKTKQAKE